MESNYRQLSDKLAVQKQESYTNHQNQIAKSYSIVPNVKMHFEFLRYLVVQYQNHHLMNH